MIERLEISGLHMVVDEKLHKYIWKKIGGLDKYIPKAARASAHAEARATETKGSDGKRYKFEITLFLPDHPLDISDQNTNIYSAVDIVEAKLKTAITKYKETHTRHHRSNIQPE